MSEFPTNAPRLKLHEPSRPRRRLTTKERGYDNRHRQIRAVLIKQYPVCQICQDKFSAHLHHIDGNTKNIDPTNLQMVCQKCHSALHNARR